MKPWRMMVVKKGPHPHSKNTYNLKDIEFEVFRNSMYF